MRVTVLVVVALFVACAPPREKFCEALTRADCRRGQRCGQVSPIVDCNALEVSWQCGNAWWSKARYFEANARACIDAREKASCDAPPIRAPFAQPGEALLDWDQSSPSCQAVFAGEVEQGGQCGDCGFCEPGLECKNGKCQVWLWAPSTACQCGEGERCSALEVSCRPAVALGGACSGFVPCEGGLFCKDARCEAAGGAGAACQAGAECLSGLCFDAVCVAYGVEGEVCSVDRACRDGFVCERSGDSSVCVAQAHPPAKCQ